jgi:hypothetical protein
VKAKHTWNSFPKEWQGDWKTEYWFMLISGDLWESARKVGWDGSAPSLMIQNEKHTHTWYKRNLKHSKNTRLMKCGCLHNMEKESRYSKPTMVENLLVPNLKHTSKSKGQNSDL